jgi:Fe-S cluster assembly protein SufD
MNTIENIKERYQRLQLNHNGGQLKSMEQNAFNAFNKLGIPVKHEEWKYTHISSLFNKNFELISAKETSSIAAKDLEVIRLPGYEQANELIFVNGVYSSQLFTKINNVFIFIVPTIEQ